MKTTKIRFYCFGCRKKIKKRFGCLWASSLETECDNCGQIYKIRLKLIDSSEFD